MPGGRTERDAVSISAAAASAADLGARGRDSRRGGREPCGGGHRRDRLWQEHSALPDPPPPRIHPSGRHRRHPAPPRRRGLRFQVPLLISFYCSITFARYAFCCVGRSWAVERVYELGLELPLLHFYKGDCLLDSPLILFLPKLSPRNKQNLERTIV